MTEAELLVPIELIGGSLLLAHISASAEPSHLYMTIH